MAEADQRTEGERTTSQLTSNFVAGSVSGVLYEFGTAFVDTTTVLPAFLGHLTGSSVAAGAAEALRRLGWLSPQAFVARYAQRRRYREPIYLVAGFGRAMILGLLALVLILIDSFRTPGLLVLFFGAWVIYTFTSGIAGVPYDDVIGRVIPSRRRSRFLAVRFLVGGLLAVAGGLLIGAILRQDQLLPFPSNYGVIFAIGAGLLALSSLAFSRVREKSAPLGLTSRSLRAFLGSGLSLLRDRPRFRRFYFYQLLAAITAMALPFYVLQATRSAGLAEAEVGVLLAAQHGGRLLANPLWGAWGDWWGKLSLLKFVNAVAGVSPGLALLVPLMPQVALLPICAVLFFFLGAVSSGELIGHIAYLMEISPDDLRAEYSGFMSTFVAPARLLPLVGAVLVDLLSFQVLFGATLLSVAARLWLLNRFEGGQGHDEGKGHPDGT